MRRHLRCHALPDEREKCCSFGITYSTAISAEVNNSILETRPFVKFSKGKETRFDVEVFSRRGYMYSSAPNGLCPRHEARMLPTANSEQQSTPRSRAYAMSVLRLFSACNYNIVSRVTQTGKHPKQKIGEKQKNDSQRHCKNLTSGIKKACRKKRRLRSEAQLSQVDVKCRMAEK